MPASKDVGPRWRGRSQGRLECGHRGEQARRDDRCNHGQLHARNVHWSAVPARIESTTSMIAWVDVVESTPVMSKSWVAVSMTR